MLKPPFAGSGVVFIVKLDGSDQLDRQATFGVLRVAFAGIMPF